MALTAIAGKEADVATDKADRPVKLARTEFG
jgi:hypothetical protein